MWKTSGNTNQPQACTGRRAALTQGLDLGQFSDRDAAFDPHGVNVAERRQPVLEVAELLAVHEHTETTPLAANLQLQTHIRTDRSETAASHHIHCLLVTLKGWSLMKGKKGTSRSASPQDPDMQARRIAWRSRKRMQSSSATSDGGSPEVPQQPVKAT